MKFCDFRGTGSGGRSDPVKNGISSEKKHSHGVINRHEFENDRSVTSKVIWDRSFSFLDPAGGNL